MPDLILMDLGLPGIDGWEATRQLKGDAATRHIPIIVLSAHAMTNDRDMALAAGGDDFDTKPVRFQQLLGKIESLLAEGVSSMIPRGSLLIVDDNEANRDALSRRLARNGLSSSTTAADGERGAGAGRRRRVRPRPARRRDARHERPRSAAPPPRDALADRSFPSSWSPRRTEGADIVEAFRLGANDYVTKPIDFPVALARIGTHLSHKWAVEDLRESEERYALAVHGANDGLWDWNLDTNEVYWSPRWKAMLGYDESAIGASPDEWLTRVHHDDAGRVKEALAAHLADAGGHYESEHRILHRNGTFRWVLCRGAAVRNGRGAATRLAGSLTDITDAKVADALTGLPNRLLFVDLLDRAIKRTERRRDYALRAARARPRSVQGRQSTAWDC